MEVFHPRALMLRAISRLTLIACVSLIGTLMIARAQAIPPAIITQNPCQLPCIYGIVPGVTDIFTQRQIASLAPWRNGSASYRLFDPAGLPAAVTFLTDVNGDIVSSIFVYRLRMNTDLGDLHDLLALEHPQGVLFSCSRATQSVYITFGENESIGAEFRPLGGVLTPDLPIISLVLLNPARERAQMSVFGCTERIAWRGFAPWWRYFRR